MQKSTTQNAENQCKRARIRYHFYKTKNGNDLVTKHGRKWGILGEIECNKKA